jgi:hypothetical protein
MRASIRHYHLPDNAGVPAGLSRHGIWAGASWLRCGSASPPSPESALACQVKALFKWKHQRPSDSNRSAKAERESHKMRNMIRSAAENG